MSKDNQQSDPLLNQEDDIAAWAAKINVDDEAQVINYAQNIRHELAEHFKAYAKSGDIKAGNAIRGLVGDMTRDIFTARKIKVEDKAADGNAAIAATLAAILDEREVKVVRHSGNEAPDTGMPSFDTSEMPELNLPPGLVSRGTPEVDIEKIISDGLAKTTSISEDED